jgi:hypothetical protein
VRGRRSLAALLHYDEFWCDVGQAGSLRPIVNRPNAANVQHSSFAACRYAGHGRKTSIAARNSANN